MSSRFSTSRLARVLALVALLCAVGIPVLEAGHLHGVSDNNAECVLCKSSAVLPLVAAVPVFALFLLSQITSHRACAPAVATCFQPRQTRGPPSRS